MQLYYLPGSPFARVVRILAIELAAPCEWIQESEFPPKLVKTFNPAMQVPTLVDGARTIFGTRLIAEYLMAEYPRTDESGPLTLFPRSTRPSDCWRDAQVLLALESLLNALVLRSYLIWTGVEHREGAAIPLDLEKLEEERIYRLLDWLEREASPTGFIPDAFSLQDAWLISGIAWTDARISIAWPGRPKLEAILRLHSSRQSVLSTSPPPWQPNS